MSWRDIGEWFAALGFAIGSMLWAYWVISLVVGAQG